LSYPPQGGASGGTQGPPGPKGEHGEKGEHGDAGEQGLQGILGSPGADGQQGIQGLKGDTGNTGAPGQNGTDGQPGQQGQPGVDGVDGEQGLKGDTGSPGAKGDTGNQGTQGNPGADGAPGAKGDKGDTGSQGPVYTPPSLIQKALIELYPLGGAPTTLTATTHSATVARVSPFEIDRPITVNAIYVRTNAVLSNCLILGIYNESGTRLWQSGVLSTVLTGWVPVTTNLPVTLPVGLYYLASTNNNVVSTTAAYTVTPALGTATLPRWGTVPATAGAIPASINPAAITKTVGGWMNYILLSNVTS